MTNHIHIFYMKKAGHVKKKRNDRINKKQPFSITLSPVKRSDISIPVSMISSKKPGEEGYYNG
jgi:hypothetical protein